MNEYIDVYCNVTTNDEARESAQRALLALVSDDAQLDVMVETMGPPLTSADNVVRMLATKLLFVAMRHTAIAADQLNFFVLFLSERMQDMHCQPVIIRMLSHVVEKYPNVLTPNHYQCVTHHLRYVLPHTLRYADRRAVYTLLYLISKATPNNEGHDHILEVIRMIDGERDPRNLLYIWSNTSPATILNTAQWVLECYLDELVEIHLQYLPITFKGDDTITRQQLIDAVVKVMLTNQHMTEQLLKHMIGDTSVSDVNQSIYIIGLLVERLKGTQYLNDVWSYLNGELWARDEESFAQCLTLIAMIATEKNAVMIISDLMIQHSTDINSRSMVRRVAVALMKLNNDVITDALWTAVVSAQHAVSDNDLLVVMVETTHNADIVSRYVNKLLDVLPTQAMLMLVNQGHITDHSEVAKIVSRCDQVSMIKSIVSDRACLASIINLLVEAKRYADLSQLIVVGSMEAPQIVRLFGSCGGHRGLMRALLRSSDEATQQTIIKQSFSAGSSSVSLVDFLDVIDTSKCSDEQMRSIEQTIESQPSRYSSVCWLGPSSISWARKLLDDESTDPTLIAWLVRLLIIQQQDYQACLGRVRAADYGILFSDVGTAPAFAMQRCYSGLLMTHILPNAIALAATLTSPLRSQIWLSDLDVILPVVLKNCSGEDNAAASHLYIPVLTTIVEHEAASLASHSTTVFRTALSVLRKESASNRTSSNADDAAAGGVGEAGRQSRIGDACELLLALTQALPFQRVYPHMPPTLAALEELLDDDSRSIRAIVTKTINHVYLLE